MIDSAKLESLFPLCKEMPEPPKLPLAVIDRAGGCLFGQLAGDSLGSLVEFQSETSIRGRYPPGISELVDGGTFDTLAGQPTDDSEMALMLARSILRAGRFDPEEAAVAYAYWYSSSPFDCGTTTSQALQPALSALERGDNAGAVAAAARDHASHESQSNGGLMRVSPLGIYAHALRPDDAAALAREDTALTHPHAICLDTSAIFVVAIAHAIAYQTNPEDTYSFARRWAGRSVPGHLGRPICSEVRGCLDLAASERPKDFQHRQGWVLIAFQNAFWQLLHAPSLEEGICDTVMRGGDTDTNAAIAGALLGAVHGVAAVPTRWREAMEACRAEKGQPRVHRPRPKPFWPVDAAMLARRLAETYLAEPEK